MKRFRQISSSCHCRVPMKQSIQGYNTYKYAKFCKTWYVVLEGKIFITDRQCTIAYQTIRTQAT